MTGRKETKVEFLRLIVKQYPSRVGVLTQQVGSLKFAEINFDPVDEAFNECLTNGIKFADNSTIISYLVLNNHMQVIRLRLFNLPFLDEKALLESLQKSYAIFNVSSKDTQFEPLTHLIPWDEQRECSFYPVWNQMPVCCRYCHEEGHVVTDCPKRRIKHNCWTCGALGHFAAECSRDKPSKKARKQPADISRLLTSVEPIEISPSMEQSVTSDKNIVPEESMINSFVDSDVTILQAPVVNSPISFYAVNVPVPSNVAIATTSRSKRLTVLLKKTSYDRPITRPHPTALPTLTFKLAESMIVNSQVSRSNEHRLNFSSSSHATDEDSVNNILQ